MKQPDNFLTNPTTATTARPFGAATDNPGDNTGSGMTAEIYNDPAYAALLVINALKEGGISNVDESVDNPDLLDAIREAIGQAVSGVDDWDSGTAYSTIGELVYYKGIQYVNIYATGNTGQAPTPGSAYWYALPSRDYLIQAYQNPTALMGMHPTLDRENAKYANLLAFGKYRLGDNGDDFYNFYRVALDGSTVTGDADLVAALDVGGSDEYPYLDIFFPDVLGTRSAIDMGGRTIRAQSSGGKADTIGEVQEDAMQRITGQATFYGNSASAGGIILADSGALSEGTTATTSATLSISGTENQRTILDFDSADSVSPSTAKTDDDETRMANLVAGAAYIISMIPA
jgi:hypothetical protein